MRYFTICEPKLAAVAQPVVIATLMRGVQQASGYCRQRIWENFLASARPGFADCSHSLLFALYRM
jgi:hypothetical protein